jgi:DNA-binding SARP family transcriptional activator
MITLKNKKWANKAFTGRSHSRDALATLLWPENDQSSARAELSRSFSVINRALGNEWLAAALETASPSFPLSF